MIGKMVLTNLLSLLFAVSAGAADHYLLPPLGGPILVFNNEAMTLKELVNPSPNEFFELKVSPNNRRLAVLLGTPVDDGFWLEVYDTDGTKISSIYLGNEFHHNFTLFTWSPDNSKIAWTRVEEAPEPSGMHRKGSIIVSDANNLKSLRVVNDSKGLMAEHYIKDMKWRKSDNKLYVDFDNDLIYAYDVDSPRTIPERSTLHALDFSPDETLYLGHYFEVGGIIYGSDDKPLPMLGFPEIRVSDIRLSKLKISLDDNQIQPYEEYITWVPSATGHYVWFGNSKVLVDLDTRTALKFDGVIGRPQLYYPKNKTLLTLVWPAIKDNAKGTKIVANSALGYLIQSNTGHKIPTR